MKYLTLPTFLQLSSVILVSICLRDSTCEIPNFTHLSTVEFCYFGQYLSVGLYM